jgi:hypothetical protein
MIRIRLTRTQLGCTDMSAAKERICLFESIPFEDRIVAELERNCSAQLLLPEDRRPRTSLPTAIECKGEPSLP